MSWTNTGDDGAVGRAAKLQVKHASGEIVEFILWGRTRMEAQIKPEWKGKVNFWYALNAFDEPAPAAAGTKQSWVLTGLPSGKTVHFAVKVHDEAGNRGKISNAVSATIP